MLFFLYFRHTAAFDKDDIVTYLFDIAPRDHYPVLFCKKRETASLRRKNNGNYPSGAQVDFRIGNISF